jgi:hypothetical protein
MRNYEFIRYDTGIYNDELHGPATYKTDGLITSNNCDFITEKRFAEAYAKAAATSPWEGFSLQWRTYIVCWMAEHVKKLNGDFVECGVNTGAYAAAIISYTGLQNTSKKFYLLDTFRGLDPDQITEEEKKAGIHGYLHAYKDVYEQVVRTFSPYPNVHIIKGRVPDTLPQCSATEICYLSIDMNCVAPEIAALEYFWDKLVDGAVVMLDDYGFPAHINQKKAFDAFAASKAHHILVLPTGQGIIFKSKR